MVKEEIHYQQHIKHWLQCINEVEMSKYQPSIGFFIKTQMVQFKRIKLKLKLKKKKKPKENKKGERE